MLLNRPRRPMWPSGSVSLRSDLRGSQRWLLSGNLDWWCDAALSPRQNSRATRALYSGVGASCPDTQVSWQPFDRMKGWACSDS